MQHFVAIILASVGLLTSGFLAVAYKVDVDKNVSGLYNI